LIVKQKDDKVGYLQIGFIFATKVAHKRTITTRALEATCSGFVKLNFTVPTVLTLIELGLALLRLAILFIVELYAKY
jgi:hypothetical protein